MYLKKCVYGSARFYELVNLGYVLQTVTFGMAYMYKSAVPVKEIIDV